MDDAGQVGTKTLKAFSQRHSEKKSKGFSLKNSWMDHPEHLQTAKTWLIGEALT